MLRLSDVVPLIAWSAWSHSAALFSFISSDLFETFELPLPLCTDFLNCNVSHVIVFHYTLLLNEASKNKQKQLSLKKP